MSDNSTFVQLQSRQSKLLDGLDELRTISSIKNFEFPQLVVCGSKGSGKSSVLEALSHIHFSGKVEGCTQFATEVIRRRGPTSTFKATLEPGPSCTDAERTERLRSFESSLSTQPFYLPNLLELAKEHLGLDKHQITDDVLKVEISEPYAPNLKIVDLPSLLPSKKEDTDIIKSLTKRYLEDTRSIILAVISAEEKSDLQNVLELASECDPKKERTMSIITHLDCLEPNSEQEKKYIDLIQNDQKSLQLGWHALHCWFYDSRPVWIEERDSKEKAFFSNTRWVAVPREYVGAICLRSRLGDIISNHAQSQIPGLIIDIQTKIANLRAKLDGMGPPRSEINQQRNYLFRISRDFERIVGQALNGVYLDDFFGSSEISDNAYDFRRFRATIRDLNDCFAEAMNLRGSRWRIQEPWETGTTENVATQLNPYLDGWAPIDIDRAMLEARISEHAHRNRGLEPPGNMNNLTVGFLFCEMSEPWEGLAQQHMEMVWGSVHHFIKLLLQCLADARTVDQLMNKVFEPRLCDMKDALSSKLQELMSYLKRGHPLPIGNSFLSRIRRVEKQGSIVNAARITDTAVVDANLTALATITASQTMRNPRSTNTAADILNQMQAYYDSAIVTFVDNVATLGIENCLLAPLEEIFTTQTISEMSDKEVTEIACEPESYQEDHKRISHELDKLKAGLNAIKSWSRNPANSRVPSTLARFYEGKLLGASLVTQ
ncbi:putative dynamin GTPase [Aspergillus homomorphus CBS 101889]|uniref:P-loop containing nucleoside triphosphate hydrolase protein n=1 Tax=Aspergillus homomorphus (strain CBS 101889) TaxID=1450537 RepID=A0A395I093_ASPHC|nr:P-loop containing nucleoside triphosphate hydrolase protein [Aspergillus homomorphus CBS 101889]RAL12548.1 P-loop containing nucleoside triphosphate hydrolase protein [Aspergillus homomorphus CBS 101889]